jgi:cytoplasmic iron level regulating protein YaaA (DUF328/UPF0246 family)
MSLQEMIEKYMYTINEQNSDEITHETILINLLYGIYRQMDKMSDYTSKFTIKLDELTYQINRLKE